MNRLRKAYHLAEALTEATLRHHDENPGSFLPEEWEWVIESEGVTFEAYLPHGFYMQARFVEDAWHVTARESAGRISLPSYNSTGGIRTLLDGANLAIRHYVRKRLAEAVRKLRGKAPGALIPCVCVERGRPWREPDEETGHCEWCHGTRFLTEAVLGLVMRHQEAPKEETP